MSHFNRRTPRVVSRLVLCSVLLFAQLPLTRGQGSDAAGLPLATGQAALRETSALVPVVFVPGTAGSELRLTHVTKENIKDIDDQLYWLGRHTLEKGRIDQGALDEKGEDTEGNSIHVPDPLTSVKVRFKSPRPIYSNFLSWARAVFGSRFHNAAYDWRKGAGKESCQALDEAIDRALDGSGHTQVILLAHSLGGFVSRDYILRTGGAKVKALIAVGTPWLGSPKTVRALLWGYNFGAGTVETSAGKIRVKGLPDDYESFNCSGPQCQRLESMSFLKLEDVKALARNLPAVYQQLPTEKFMQQYGEVYGKTFRGPIWNMDTWAEMKGFYRDANSRLFDDAETWREKFLSGQASHVKNYLVGGYYAPECKLAEGRKRDHDKNRDQDKDEYKDCEIENRMDMRMANVNQINKSDFSKRFSARINVINALLALFKYKAHRDPFVAIDSDYQWGDGTAPLLSATAGEYVRGDKGHVKPGEAIKYLGAGTEVRKPIQLGPKFGHSAMLDDPQVRKEIVDLYKAESAKLGLKPLFAEDTEDVTSLRVKIQSTSKGFEKSVTVRLAAGGFVSSDLRQTAFINQELAVEFKDLEVEDRLLRLPRDGSSVPDRVRRRLLTSDLHHLTFYLENNGRSGKQLVITSVQLFVNKSETPLIDHREEINLGRSPESIPWTRKWSALSP
jgi:pimeloyl-ACP methyl ester carboxylesterase